MINFDFMIIFAQILQFMNQSIDLIFAKNFMFRNDFPTIDY